jgi:hypothetical protein
MRIGRALGRGEGGLGETFAGYPAATSYGSPADAADEQGAKVSVMMSLSERRAAAKSHTGATDLGKGNVTRRRRAVHSEEARVLPGHAQPASSTNRAD